VCTINTERGYLHRKIIPSDETKIPSDEKKILSDETKIPSDETKLPTRISETSLTNDRCKKVKKSGWRAVSPIFFVIFAAE